MKLLCIGAHPDDNEFRCGGLALKLKAKGHEVQFLSACNGDRGHQTMSLEETAARRAGEMAAVAKILGIQYDVWSDVHDCELTADLETRRRMIRYIRAANPDIIITHRNNDYHADHRNVAMLVQDAAYLLTVPHECPDVPAMRFMPVIMFNEDTFAYPPYRPDIAIDVDSVVDQKIELMDKHVSQVYEWLPYTRGEVVTEDPVERLKWLKEVHSPRRKAGFCKTANRHRELLVQLYGERGNEIQNAEVFQVSEYGSALSEELRQELLSL